MGLRIKTNIESLVSQRRLSENRAVLGDSLAKMSSGLRINKSADDAAGLAISEAIRSRIASLNSAKRNASDGISFIQVAEGGLNEVTNIVVRMRELASQSASDTIGNRERMFLDKEFQQLRQEVGRIVDSTEFNGSRVLRSEGDKPMQIFVGASNRGVDSQGNLPDIDPDNDPDVLTIDLSDLSSLSEALSQITQEEIGVVCNDPAGGAQELGPSGDTAELFRRLDNSLNAIASYRATLGSVQARMNSTITNIDISAENLAAAQSRIRDVDYAEESAKYAQAKILTSAGVAVLSQANQTPEFALNLIH